MAENSGGDKNAAERTQTAHSKRKLVWAVAGMVLIVVAGWGIWLAHKRSVFSTLWGNLQALPQSPAWDWLVAAFLVALGLLGVVALWKGPQWQVARIEGLDSEKRFDKRNEARKTLATILGGIAFLTGGFFTWRNFNLAQESLRVNQEGRITDRFTKAIEQLGAVDASGKPKLEVRLGGIYSLEAIAKESESFHWPIVEVLSAYVRENATVNMAEVLHSEEAPSVLHAPTDIQAIITVLGRRNRESETTHQRLDLRRASLSGAQMGNTNFSGTWFINAELRGAILNDADLRQAKFEAANLSGAFLWRTNLRGAHLKGAILVGAYLSEADLTNAQIGMANLGDARNLTQAQIDAANGDVHTKLPKGLCLPRRWEDVTADTPSACCGP